MIDSPVVLETNKHREKIAASFGFDLERIDADLQSRVGRGRKVDDQTRGKVRTNWTLGRLRRDQLIQVLGIQAGTWVPGDTAS